MPATMKCLPVVALLLTAIPIVAEDKTSGDWRYSVSKNGKGTIVAYAGDDADVVVPAELDGVKITHIGQDAFALPANFSGTDSMKSAVLPEGLLEIGGAAFERRQKLTNVVIPKSVELIEFYAFGSCGALLSVEVSPENLTYASVDGVIFNKADKTLFQYPVGKAEKTYTIPAWVEVIGDAAFVKAKNLNEVVIPEGVKVIGLRAFDEASNLQNLNIPASVETIRDNAFYGCASLTNISVPTESQRFASVDGVLFDKEKKFLWQYPAAKEGQYTVPDGVAKIGKFAFQGSGLTNIILPKSVTDVADKAFHNSALTSATLPEALLNKADTFGLSEELAARLKAQAPPSSDKADADASTASNKVPESSGLPSLTVGGVTYKNAILKKEYPLSLFIKHDEGTAFVKRNELTEEQLTELSGTASN